MFSTFKYSGLPKGTAPGAPTSVVVQRAGRYTIGFYWNAPASNGNRPITGYIVNLDGEGTRSVGFSNSGGIRTFGYGWNISCATCNYSGSVQAVNSIGTGPGAGGTACAEAGLLLSSGNCSGYTRYDTYTDGSCGSYDVATEYNSVSCGYNPCTCSTAITYSQCDGCAGGGGCDRQTCYRDTCCNITCYCAAQDCCGPS